MRNIRAIRRHHKHRVIARRKAYLEAIGVTYNHSYASTGTPCSCIMCRNPRRTIYQAITRQECRADLDYREQVEAYC